MAPTSSVMPSPPSPPGMSGMSGSAGFRAPRMRPVTRARMLAAVAVAGTAALLAACSSVAPGQSTAPTAPSARVEGAAPVPIDDERLANLKVQDLVAADGYALRWDEPGETVAFFLGGSGGGGGCIPQPHPIELDATAEELHLRFDPPDPATACTADFRIHGWQLALPEPIDAEQVWPVLLHDLQEPGSTVEARLGPDDDYELGPAADPQPSVVPGQPPAGATTPTPIAPDRLPSADALDQTQFPMVAVQWIEPGATLAVMLGGSGVEACVPQPVAGWSTGVGTIEVAFAASAHEGDCSADLHVYGWEVTLPEPVSATLPVEVTVTGAEADGSAATDTVEPDEVFER